MGVSTGWAISRPLVTLMMDRVRQKRTEVTDELHEECRDGSQRRPRPWAPAGKATRVEADRNTQSSCSCCMGPTPPGRWRARPFAENQRPGDRGEERGQGTERSMA